MWDMTVSDMILDECWTPASNLFQTPSPPHTCPLEVTFRLPEVTYKTPGHSSIASGYQGVTLFNFLYPLLHNRLHLHLHCLQLSKRHLHSLPLLPACNCLLAVGDVIPPLQSYNPQLNIRSPLKTHTLYTTIFTYYTPLPSTFTTIYLHTTPIYIYIAPLKRTRNNNANTTTIPPPPPPPTVLDWG